MTKPAGCYFPCLLTCLALSGCAESSAPEPAPVAMTLYVWDTDERPYEVLGVTTTNVRRLGDQTRTSQAIISHPQNRELVEDALQEMYEQLKQDIEQTQADAEYRRISISIYDAHEDITLDSRAWLCRLEVAPDGHTPLPEWESVEAQWQWRDPAAAPSDEERAIEWEYLGMLQEVDRSVQFPVSEVDLLGLDAAGRRDFYEQRYANESAEIKRRAAESHGMSVDELEQLLDRILAWKFKEEELQPSS
jgi:hypothetical protein